MKKLSTLFALLLLFAANILSAQSLGDLERKLNNPATSKSERLSLSYSLAEKYMGSNPGKAADYAHRASMLASELKNSQREVAAVLLCGDAHFKNKNTSEASARYGRAFSLAKSYGYSDVAFEAVKKLQDVSTKVLDYKAAFKWSQEEVTLLRGGKSASGKTTSSSERSRYENQISLLENDNQRLRRDLAAATGRTELLETNYRETEAALKDVKNQTETVLEKKDEQLEQVSQKYERADSLIRKKDKMLQEMTKEQIADSLLLSKKEVELETQKKKAAEAELAKRTGQYIQYGLGLIAAFVLVLAGLFYNRYRAKKRAATDLEEKNTQIEAQKRRSDDLLLNILPTAIANELKDRGAVSPRLHQNATVMFIDFKGFTHVSERLTPEQLVEEIHYCFSNFDRIISQFHIEKIKTIGDAYMCASGLSDKSTHPGEMVQAALEIQDFLLHLKAERSSRNLPFFEARVGIHSGPVVAGVVGTKKFAYDIWGDTVNIAARMEEACEPGKVNVSEMAFSQAKYEFEWLHRGKIPAKNKGMIDMYYVTGMR